MFRQGCYSYLRPDHFVAWFKAPSVLSDQDSEVNFEVIYDMVKKKR
jgi:hypothetical protein